MNDFVHACAYQPFKGQADSAVHVPTCRTYHEVTAGCFSQAAHTLFPPLLVQVCI